MSWMHFMMSRWSSLTYFVLLMVWVGCEQTDTTDTPIQNTEALQVSEDLRVELLAAEPLVVDPVAYTVDAEGYMYVAENRGYPDPATGGQPAKKEGRIARLEDKDGDGIYDSRKEFAGDFTYPNGVLAWRDGIFVTCAPDIWYLRDTDDDGIADERKVVLTGFFDTKTAQIRMSHPTLGLDGWIYVTGGLNGGRIVSPDHPDRDTVSYKSGDGRFHPETYEFQVTGGKSQFGITMDAFGQRFGCSNRHPVQHIVMEPWFLNRNKQLRYSETVQNVSPVQAEAVVYPISGSAITADFIPRLIGRSHQGSFTSASSVFIYRDQQGLGSDHYSNVFICESAQNLVQRQIMQHEGATFSSQIARDGVEFLASEDKWFRPVFLGHGPSGGLYVLDMRRKVIDHPAYIPESIRESFDYHSGNDQGRIYRIHHKNYPSKRKIVNLKSMAAADLVDMLESDLAWHRSTAFRLLLERKDEQSHNLLREMLKTGKLAEARVRSLSLLQVLGKLEPADLLVSMADEHAGIRAYAVQISHDLLDLVGVRTALIEVVDDPVMAVRFQAALALGSSQNVEALKGLASIASRDGADVWSRVAILSGIGGRVSEFLEVFQANEVEDREAYAAVMQDLGRMIGQGVDEPAFRRLLTEAITSSESSGWRIATALGLMQGLVARSSTPAAGLWKQSTASLEAEEVTSFLRFCASMAQDSTADLTDRTHAVALLGYSPSQFGLTLLREVLSNPTEPDLQLQAVLALGIVEVEEAADVLIAKELWSTFTPKIRASVISQLVGKKVFIEVLLDAIDQGTVKAGQIPSSDRKRLMNSKDDSIRARAEAVFKVLEGGDRMKVYQDYQSVLDTPGIAANGLAVFLKICSACHSYGGQGGNVGPDLSGMKNQPADALLLHTIVPNYEVYPMYQATMVETKGGQNLAGWIKAETENSITLRTAYGSDENILRSNIKSIHNSGRSLMPDGLEQTISREEIRHLISYLKSGGENPL